MMHTALVDEVAVPNLGQSYGFGLPVLDKPN